jgi:hypothetical protein
VLVTTNETVPLVSPLHGILLELEILLVKVELVGIKKVEGLVK